MADTGKNEVSTIENEHFAHALPPNYEAYTKLPLYLKKRVKALKKLQYKTMEIDTEFYKKLFNLEKEFESRHQESFDRRFKVISGEYEPTEEESDWKSEGEDEGLSEDLKEKAKVTEGDLPDDQKLAGLPDFWYKALNHFSLIQTMIMDHDRPVLKHITDIKCTLITETDPGFLLEFFFSANEWFTNTVLTKRYFFSFDIPEDDPFGYTGPEIIASQGCVIKWNAGKNITVKQIKKVQKHKSRNDKRTLTKTVPSDSIFNFFSPDKQCVTDEDTDPDLLDVDFKIGQFFRESFIPRAVLYYTGEASDDEFDDDDEDDYFGGDDEEDEDDDEEDDDHPKKSTKSHAHHHHTKDKRGGHQHPKKDEECKQQ